MKPTDLTGAQRRLYEAFRGSGMSQEAALAATAGRGGQLRPPSSFAALTDAFVGLGMSEDAASLAAVGRTTEHEARVAHASIDRQREDAAVVSTVRDLTARYCREDRALTEQQAQARASARAREAFAGTEHAARVDALLRREFPPAAPVRDRRPARARAVEQLQDAKRRRSNVRVVDEHGRPTGRILTLAEIDQLLGGR